MVVGVSVFGIIIGIQLEELDEEEHGKTVKVDTTIITPVLQDYTLIYKKILLSQGVP